MAPYLVSQLSEGGEGVKVLYLSFFVFVCLLLSSTDDIFSIAFQRWKGGKEVSRGKRERKTLIWEKHIDGLPPTCALTGGRERTCRSVMCP